MTRAYYKEVRSDQSDPHTHARTLTPNPAQAHGAIVVCDSSRLATLETGAERWRQDIATKLDQPPIPVVLAINKVRRAT